MAWPARCSPSEVSARVSRSSGLTKSVESAYALSPVAQGRRTKSIEPSKSGECYGTLLTLRASMKLADPQIFR